MKFHAYKTEVANVYFKIPSKFLRPSCEKSPNTDNWYYGVETINAEKIEWIGRRPVAKEDCQDFMKKAQKILSESNIVEIFGDSSDGPQAELLMYGAMKGKTTCHEWFVGDCQKLK